MHIQGTPQTMQINPQYQDVIKEIKTYFSERLNILSQKGISLDKVILDPGLGFGKNFTHNISLLKGLKEFQEFDRPILLGPSRKSFIGEILKKPVSERDAGTAGVAIFAYLQGVHFLRVHNVAMVQDTLKTFKYLFKELEG